MNNILQNIKSSVELHRIYQRDSNNFEKRDEVLEIIDNAVFRGAKLISNVRKLSKLEDTDMLVEKTEACQVLEDSIIFLKKGFQDKKINVKIKAPSKELHVRANALLLDVFENILNNAVKYNDKHDVEILVKISKEQELEQKYIRFEFIDNGIGIPDAKKAVIFQKGYKKDSSVEGLGIGLSLVKMAIDIYKGKIWVEDRIKDDYSKGCNFIILIPEADFSHS
jgi:signal transduction histidine kinase